ncbi:hypothetical protein GTY84_08110 [Streptomyces sp. SID8352]|nr:hypothetical protein [Streptomyces sp. SID8352]
MRCGIARGGDFSAFVRLEDPRHPLRADARATRAGSRARRHGRINTRNPVAHPEQPDIDVRHHFHLELPDSARSTRGTPWPSTPDRSTGRRAAPRRHQRQDGATARPGPLPPGRTSSNESFIDSRSTGRLRREATVGDRPGVLPRLRRHRRCPRRSSGRSSPPAGTAPVGACRCSRSRATRVSRPAARRRRGPSGPRGRSPGRHNRPARRGS